MQPRGASRALVAGTVVVLAAWAFSPVVLLVLHANAVGATWTGADGLIGADGVLGADQLQYLSWARSIAGHGLAADLFVLHTGGNVFVEPASGVTGGLAALGVGLVASELVVTAIAVVVLGAAAVAWVRRFLPDRPGRQLAGLALVLFTVTPATALVNWLQLGGARFRFAVYLAGDETLVADKLWGYVPAALGIALLAVAVLALERAVPGGPRTGRRGALALAAMAALVGAWSHPWQGIVLALVVVGLAVVRRRPAELAALGVVLVAAVAPVAYYGLLAHADAAWRMAAHNESGAHLPGLVLLACVGPLVGLAALGVRRPGPALGEQALLLWIPASVLAYLVDDAFATHALQGISFPFAVLAVRGAGRLRLAPVLGVAGVLLLTVPGLAYDARKFVRTSDSGLVQYALPADDAAALRWVARGAPAGGVLAPTPFASVVPSRTGRPVWVGHGDWSPHYRARARAVDRLFDGRLRPAGARAFVASTGARLLVADCAHPSPRLEGALRERVAEVRRFGCATVLVLRR